MAYTTLSSERDGRVARITFERPERLNAIAAATPGEIADAVAEANADDRVHVIVLAGRGAAFCAGYDLRDFAEGPSELTPESRLPTLPLPMRREPKMSEIQESQNTQALSDIEKEMVARVTLGSDGLNEILGLLEKMAIREDKTIRTFSVPACNADG